MKKLQKPRKKWLIYLDYVLLPATSFFAVYNYIKGNFSISIFMFILVVLSFGRLIKDKKISK